MTESERRRQMEGLSSILSSMQNHLVNPPVHTQREHRVQKESLVIEGEMKRGIDGVGCGVLNWTSLGILPNPYVVLSKELPCVSKHKHYGVVDRTHVVLAMPDAAPDKARPLSLSIKRIKCSRPIQRQ